MKQWNQFSVQILWIIFGNSDEGSLIGIQKSLIIGYKTQETSFGFMVENRLYFCRIEKLT